MRALGASRTSLVPGGVLAGPWVRNDLWRRARAVPSLDLRFADNKSLVDAVTGASLVTFTRASSGTYVGSDGVLQTAATNAPRFDHNPTTGESLGLLVEEQRANLLLRSEEFDTTWTRTNVAAFGSGSEVNVETAPNGTLTADLIATLSGNNSGTGFIGQTITKSATATTYTVTVFAKAQNWNTVRLHVNDTATSNNRATVTFSLATGAITTAAAVFGTFSAASATPASSFADGWFKANLTFTSSTETGLLVRVFPDNSSTVTADGTSGVYLWGAQLEAGAFPTSYIPTTTAAVTRSADVVSITGSNYTSWANNNEGTVFSDSSIIASQVKTQAVWELSGGTVLSSLRQPHGTANQFRAVIGGTFTGSPGTGATLTTGVTRAAVAYSGTAGRLQVESAGANATGSALDATSLSIGSLAGSTQLNGRIKRLCFWPTRLADSTLQQLTQ
jgi:hypothetical protein